MVEIEKLSAEADFADAVALLTTAFGQGFSAERVRALVTDPRTFAAIARASERVVFVGIASLDADVESRFAVFGDAAMAALRGRRVGVLESGATAPEARRQGIAGRAAARLMAWLDEGGCDVIAAGSWGSGGADQSRGLLERLGFRAIADVSGEAYRVRNLAGRPCVVCGVPCRCSGTLFVLDR